MDIRRLQQEDYAQIKHVWSVCFGDSDAFIDAYFHFVTRPQDGLAITENGKLLSDLFMLDFCGKTAGMEYPAKFLAGCATMPEARKKDMMRTLVRHALLDMREKGICLSYLHPFLHAFYRKFGYETIAYVNRRQIAPDKKPEGNIGVRVAKSMAKTPLEAMHAAYAAYTMQYDNCFVRDTQRFRAWMELLYADGGQANIITQGGQTGYALYYDQDGARDVFELVYFSEAQRLALLNADTKNIARIDYSLLAAENYAKEGNEEFTMMRVLDPVRLLEDHRFDGRAEFVIRIEDAFLEQDYVLHVVCGGERNIVREADAAPDIQTDIQGFAQMVTGSYAASAGTNIIKLFKRKNSCFFETY